MEGEIAALARKPDQANELSRRGSRGVMLRSYGPMDERVGLRPPGDRPSHRGLAHHEAAPSPDGAEREREALAGESENDEPAQIRRGSRPRREFARPRGRPPLAQLRNRPRPTCCPAAEGHRVRPPLLLRHPLRGSSATVACSQSARMLSIISHCIQRIMPASPAAKYGPGKAPVSAFFNY